ncbi:MAG: hypothetical protein LUC43_05610 [Burkholderiales bacterium]|nr:hypothetical protein [Burkholderiales bacterium]
MKKGLTCVIAFAISTLSLTTVTAAEKDTDNLQPICQPTTLAQAKDCHDGDMFLFAPGDQFVAAQIDFVNPTMLMSMFCDFRYTIKFTDYQTGLACIYKKKTDTDKKVDTVLSNLSIQEKEAE